MENISSVFKRNQHHESKTFHLFLLRQADSLFSAVLFIILYLTFAILYIFSEQINSSQYDTCHLPVRLTAYQNSFMVVSMSGHEIEMLKK